MEALPLGLRRCKSSVEALQAGVQARVIGFISEPLFRQSSPGGFLLLLQSCWQ